MTTISLPNERLINVYHAQDAPTFVTDLTYAALVSSSPVDKIDSILIRNPQNDAITMTDDLCMTFALKVDDRFYAEPDIAAHIDHLSQLAVDESISALSPKLALAIHWQGENILGADYWDEFFHVMDIIIGSVDMLVAGEQVDVYLSRGTWLRLRQQPDDADMLEFAIWDHYKTTSMATYTLPLMPFIAQMTRCFLRLTRLTLAWGQEQRQTILDVITSGDVNPHLRDAVGMDTLRHLATADLHTLLTQSDCVS